MVFDRGATRIGLATTPVCGDSAPRGETQRLNGAAGSGGAERGCTAAPGRSTRTTAPQSSSAISAKAPVRLGCRQPTPRRPRSLRRASSSPGSQRTRWLRDSEGHLVVDSRHEDGAASVFCSAANPGHQHEPKPRLVDIKPTHAMVTTTAAARWRFRSAFGGPPNTVSRRVDGRTRSRRGARSGPCILRPPGRPSRRGPQGQAPSSPLRAQAEIRDGELDLTLEEQRGDDERPDAPSAEGAS